MQSVKQNPQILNLKQTHSAHYKCNKLKLLPQPLEVIVGGLCIDFLDLLNVAMTQLLIICNGYKHLNSIKF